MNKIELIKELNKKGIFWSYDITNPNKVPDNIIIEHVLRWGDVSDILMLFKLFDYNHIKQVWGKSLIPDDRIYSHNYYLARVFFNINDVEEYLNHKRKQNNRYERIKKLTS